MQTIEVTGNSLDEAKEQAAKLLGAAAKSLKVTVLEETKGLFGKGTVRILAEAPETKSEGEEPEAKLAAKSKGRASARKTKEPEAAPEEEKPAPKKLSSRKSAKAEEPVAAAEATEGEAPQVVATEEDGDRVLEIVNSVLQAGEFEVAAKVVSLNARYVNVELDGKGKELGYLVGKNGEVLNALQYVLNIIVSQQLKNGVRLTLDANDYRTRRESALNNYAEQIATEVRNRKEEAVLDPLPAFERRIIHKALSAMEGVTTYSEGEEPNRRVVIAPAD
jgi:spoIIIJ-associated protein